MALSDEKRQAIDALSRGANDTSAARLLGINRATIGRWKKEPEFSEALRRAQGEAGEEAVAGLGMLVPQALKMLEGYLGGTLDIPAAKATAALNVIKAAATVDRQDGNTTSAFEERLKELDLRDAR